ncbi:MAG: OFA family MFS transporter [Methanosarcinales archaeon]|jgi:OFA family oxalate/formate antiporter-like MFS transporter|nr:OFA family MFS transporter [Methanosarcinales archaeon]
MENSQEIRIDPKKRYYILAAGMVMQFCAGIIYMWSVFKQPIADALNWDAGSAALTASIMLSMLVLGLILGGYAQDKYGPKKATLVGSILVGGGMILTAFVTSAAPWLVYITYGVIGGLGIGTVYTSTVAAVQKWFPDRRGFASGMIISAFGLSLVVFAPLATVLINNIGVQMTFLVFGAAFLLILSFFSLFIQNPPTGYLPPGYTPPKAVSMMHQFAPKEIIKTKQFYLLAGGLFFTLSTFSILNPVFISLGVERGLTPELAVLGVALVGISSTAGRLTVAWTSDRVGRKAAMMSVAIITLIAALIMIFGTGALFLICIMLIAFGFGGAASVYATMTSESFGTKYGGMNFGLVMLGFGASALVFPFISNILTADGSYTNTFILAAATCAIAIVLVLMMRDPRKEAKKEAAAAKT